MITAKIQEDLISALKAGDKKKLDTLRYVVSRFKNKEIDKKAELTDEEATDILAKVKKELQDSITAFQKGGREDLVAGNQGQIQIIDPYLPQELSDEELEKAVLKLIEENRKVFDKNPQGLIGIAMKSLKSKAAPARIITCINRHKI